jgi:hypothetical protein
VVFIRDLDVPEFIRRVRIQSEIETADFRLFLFCDNCATAYIDKYTQLLTTENGDIVWSSFVPFFDAEHCDEAKFVIHNRFAASQQQWQKPIERPATIKNFNGCPIVAHISNRLWDKISDIEAVAKLFTEVIDIMGKVGNFTPNATVIFEDSPADENEPDFTMVEAMIIDTYAEINLEASLLFTDVTTVFVVTAGELVVCVVFLLYHVCPIKAAMEN